MKIAIVCPDGLSVLLFLKGVIRTLKERDGVEVVVVNDDGEYKEEIEALGTKSIRVEMCRFMSPLKDVIYTAKLYRIFKQENIDVVINVSTKPNIYGTIAAKLSRSKKILCSVWGRGAAFVDDTSVQQQLLKMSLSALYWVAFKLSDKVWFTNMNDYEYFRSRHTVSPQKVILTKNYVNIEEYSPSVLPLERLEELRTELHLTDQHQVVVMVGRMIWAKGVREFVEASRLLEEKLPFVKFILVGPEEDGSADAVPVSYLREHERSNNFQWVGFRNDVKDLYRLADLAVLPSYYREGGFPRALTEPMSMGKPIIASDSVDCRSPVEDGKNGYLVPIKNAHALASRIEELMLDEEKRAAFGRYSRSKAKKELDENVVVPQVIEAFL
jgi:N,N'-diacetylbacillosaminyl-diphospho-undecaprenol alpha-1,3-N-acetylgalactosaminyltransferase